MPGSRSALSSAISALGACGPPKTAATKPSRTQLELDPLAMPYLAQPCDTTTQDGLSTPLHEMKLQSLLPLTPTANRALVNKADYDLGRRIDSELLPSSTANPARNFITEAVLGSLPRPLSVKERASVSASVPLSSTITKLSTLPSDKVLSRTAEGQRLRRRCLRGAVLVFVTAGYSGKRFVYEKAKELGVRVVIIDGPDSWSQVLVEEGVAEKFIGLDMSDAESVFQRCLDSINTVREELGTVDGVLSFCEMAQPLVARLAEHLGLPANSPEAVDAARDKHSTRSRMAAAGLPTPRNFLITQRSQLQEAAALVGFPAVIKPIYGAASIGVVRVDDFEHLKRAYTRVCKDLAAARVVAGALLEGEVDEEEEQQLCEHRGNASSWIQTTIMMEEYLDGPEVDVDLIFSEGQPVYGAVNDNWPTVEPYFNETGSNGPSVLPMDQQRELADLAVKTVKTLGFTLGVFHVELKYSSRGARLIEVNCRMGGGVVRNMNLLVWGVDMAEEQLLCSAGIPSRPQVAAKPLLNVAEYLVNAMHTGILRDTHFLDKYLGQPDIIYARAMVEPGSKVVCAQDGLPTWVCQVLVTRPTVEEAMQLVTDIEAEIQTNMPIDPLPKH